MADEMLGAIDDEIIALLFGKAFHATDVRANAGFGHGEAIHHFSLYGGEEIFFALFADAGHKDVGGPCDAIPMERVIGAAQLFFIENPSQRVEAGTARFDRHVGGVEAGGNGLGLDFLTQRRAQNTGGLDLDFMRIEFVGDEIARRLDDHVLFFGELESMGVT